MTTRTQTELEAEFQLKIKKLAETLKEIYEKPPTPTKEEMCERLATFIEAGDEKAREIYEEACRETKE
jgi:N-acetylglucosamine kinase-like BadF-type ATPase